jgi:hypothetical protein
LELLSSIRRPAPVRYSAAGLLGLTGARLLVHLVWAPLADLGVCESGDVGGVELSYSIRGAPAKALWRRCRLWKISRCSKIALARSMRVVHR